MDNKKNKVQICTHIDDETTALYADAVSRDQQPELPEHHLVHVEGCNQCKDKILDLAIFLRNPDSSSHPIFTDTFLLQRDKTMRGKFLRIAALFILAVLVAAAYLLLFKDFGLIRNETHHSSEGNKFHEAVPLENQIPEGKISQQKHNTFSGKLKSSMRNEANTIESYRVNPNLESMIDSKYRSSDAEILSPRNNVHLRGEILFSWKDKSHRSLTLKIINNKNEIFINQLVNENRYFLRKVLSPGLYYWKLENRDDLLYIGKFFIE